jgi:hypothetical protein
LSFTGSCSTRPVTVFFSFGIYAPGVRATVTLHSHNCDKLNSAPLNFHRN